MRQRTIPYLFMAFLAVALQCGTEKITGNNPKIAITGTLYQAGGKSPAAGIRAVIRPQNSLAEIPQAGLSKILFKKDSVTTDNSGRFSFATALDPGMYRIEARSGNEAVLIDSVAVKNDTSTNFLPPDTLKPSGAIKGAIILSEGGDLKNVFVLAFGIDRFTIVEEEGSFAFNNLAEGTYDLRVIPVMQNYDEFDIVNIHVKSADTTYLDTITMVFDAIPVPQNVKIVYDTGTQTATLSWDRPNAPSIKGYNIYRRNIDSNEIFLAPLNSDPVADTFFLDSTGKQGITYEYRIAAMDTIGSEGAKSAAVRTNSASYFTLDTAYYALETASGTMRLSPSDLSISKEGDIFIADEYNGRILIYDSAMHYKNQIGIGVLRHPYRVSVDSQGLVFVADYSDSLYAIDVFSPSGTLINTITDTLIGASGIYDIDAKDSLLYIVAFNPDSIGRRRAGGDEILIYSFNGVRKGAWKCPDEMDYGPIAKGDSNKIFVLDLVGHINCYNAMGNQISSIALPSPPLSFIYDEKKQYLFFVCLASPTLGYSFFGLILYVMDRNYREIGQYKINSFYGHYGYSIGIQKDGAVYLVAGESSCMLKLMSLLK